MFKGKLHHGTYGSPPYMSPEMVAKQGHDMATDVWSFGATVYTLLYGEWLYKPHALSIPAMKQAIRTNSPRPRFAHSKRSATSTSAAIGDLTPWLRIVLTREQAIRPSAKDALELLRKRLERSLLREHMN